MKLLEDMKNRIYLILILIISLILIFYKFNQIPKNLDRDEVEFAKLALSLDQKPYTPYSPLATGHTTLYFYLILFSLKVFGVNNFALRLPSAAFGLLNPIIFYLIVVNLFKKNKNFFLPGFFPFFITFIFLTCRWYFSFARFAYEVTFLLFLELLSLYFLIKFFDKKTSCHLCLILSGIFSGLAFNSYLAGRIFFLLPLFLLVVKLKNKRKDFIYFLIPFIILTLPLNIYFLNQPDYRFKQQFFWENSDLIFSQKINFTLENIKKISLMFSFYGDINGRHNYPGKPALNPIIGLFFYLGLIYSLVNIKKNFYFLFFIFYFFLSLFPSLLTYPWENPNMLRTFTTLPSICFFIGQGLINIIKFLKQKQVQLFIINYFLLIIILLSSFYEIRTYFKYQKDVFNKAFEINKSLNKVIKINH